MKCACRCGCAATGYALAPMCAACIRGGHIRPLARWQTRYGRWMVPCDGGCGEVTPAPVTTKLASWTCDRCAGAETPMFVDYKALVALIASPEGDALLEEAAKLLEDYADYTDALPDGITRELAAKLRARAGAASVPEGK